MHVQMLRPAFSSPSGLLLSAAAVVALVQLFLAHSVPPPGLENTPTFTREAAARRTPTPHFASLPEWERCSAQIRPRLQRYCNSPPKLAQLEGVPPFPGAVLRQVLINIRHGDRSAIHTLPATTRASWECGLPSLEDTRWAAALLTPLHSTRACIDREVDCPSSNVTLLGLASRPARIHAAFRAWRTARVLGEPCGPTGGELSTTGWSQLLHIGYSLGGVYRELLSRDERHTSALRVVSTDTGRTALSATALTQGLLAGAAGWEASEGHPEDPPPPSPHSGHGGAAALPPRGVWAERAWIHRHTVPPLPQLTVPLLLHVLARADDPMMFGKGRRAESCPALSARIGSDPVLGAQADAAFELAALPAELAERIAMVADVPVSSVPGTEETADDVLTRMCGGHPLPCWHPEGSDPSIPALLTGMRCGSGGLVGGEEKPLVDAALEGMEADAPPHTACLTVHDAAALLQRADTHYSKRYSSPFVGTLMYPFLSQLVNHMRAAVRREQGVPRVMVRAAHDTVVAPVAAALNVTDPLEPWPRYAARMVLELWEAPAGVEVMGPGGAAAPDAGAESRAFVRLLYNGADRTAELACALPTTTVRAAAAQAEQDDGGVQHSLCSLQRFGAMVAALIAPHRTWEEACGTTGGASSR